MNLTEAEEIAEMGWPDSQMMQRKFDAMGWLIAEVKKLQLDTDTLREDLARIDELEAALGEMLALWERVHGQAIIGRPTTNAARKVLGKPYFKNVSDYPKTVDVDEIGRAE